MRKIAFLHASPAALTPLAHYYKQAAPDLEITNLLDDGLLRLFAAGAWAVVELRLGEMLATARDVHAAEAALLTCSAVPGPILARLRRTAGLPVLKIDESVARAAVRAGRRIGLVVTFPPTLETSRTLLEDAAAEVGISIDIVSRLVPQAYDALLAGDAATHDQQVLTAIEELTAEGVEVIVLAQVSMARVLPSVEGRIAVPILSSLHTSLEALRELLAERPSSPAEVPAPGHGNPCGQGRGA